MHYVIIGGSAAGISAAESIRGIDKKSAITLIGDEVTPLYSRCLLSYLLAGTINEGNVHFKKRNFFQANDVEALLGVRAETIDTKASSVKASGKQKIAYDKLLIATGSRSKMLEIPGVEKDGVFALRTIKDARGIEATLKRTRTAVVLGGGLIGLRAAYALNSRGVIVKVVVKSSQILSQIVDAQAAAMVQGRVEQKGITIMKGLQAREIRGKEKVQGVSLDDGKTVECELVIIGKGVEPNINLARDAGVETGYGIRANDFLETSAKGIYAAGDVAETKDITSGEVALNAIWPCAVEQGTIAGRNMAGEPLSYDGSMAMNSIEFFGLPVISMGITRPKSPDYEQLSALSEKRGYYRKVVLKDGIIKGFISAGSIEHSGVYNVLIKNRVNVSSIKEVLLDEHFNYAKAMPLIRENKDKFHKDEFKDSIITY